MAFTTPHPLKKRSIELGNMPVVMVPLMIYSDDTSGNKSKVWNKDMTRYYKSFVGQDFKLLAQLAVHLSSPYMDDGEKEVWFKLSKVFRIAYCQPFDPEMVGSYESDCSSCVTAILANLKRKLKVHLLLHLCESMLQFGPPLAYNTERCESFNPIIRAKNIFSNKHSPSKYIATNFGAEDSTRNICSGISDKFGAELVELYKSDVMSKYLGKHVESEKCIYQQGTLRKLSTAALELGAIKMTIPERGAILLSQPIASCTLLMPPSIKSCNQFYCHLWIWWAHQHQ
eukprot:Em0987g1a